MVSKKKQDGESENTQTVFDKSAGYVTMATSTLDPVNTHKKLMITDYCLATSRVCNLF